MSTLVPPYSTNVPYWLTTGENCGRFDVGEKVSFSVEFGD